jgi:uncharacterized membrane protein
MRSRWDLPFVIVCGLVLGAIVHLIVVLRVPAMAQRDAFARLSPITKGDSAQLVTGSVQPQDMPLPDPAVAVAVCSFNLSKGPLRIAASAFPYLETLSFHQRGGGVFYALTDRAAVRGSIEIMLMTQRQLDEQLAREDEDEIVRELRIVSPVQEGLVVARALAPWPSQKKQAEDAVRAVSCGRAT